jgi:hypothetical protein
MLKHPPLRTAIEDRLAAGARKVREQAEGRAAEKSQSGRDSRTRRRSAKTKSAA